MIAHRATYYRITGSLVANWLSVSMMTLCRWMPEVSWTLAETCSLNMRIALFQRPDHPGFSELIRVQSNYFHEDPCRLWNGPLIVGWAVRHAKDMSTVEKQDLTQARALALRQTTVPAVTAADQVSIVLEPDEGEYQGATAPAQSARPSHGGRAKFAKRG